VQTKGGAIFLWAWTCFPYPGNGWKVRQANYPDGTERKNNATFTLAPNISSCPHVRYLHPLGVDHINALMSRFSDHHETNNNEWLSWLEESNEQLIVVVFIADWVGTVEILRSFLNKICLEMPGVALRWVDVEEYEHLSLDVGINQIPSIILLRNREVVDHINGLIPRRSLAARMEPYL
jgi:thioredoxin 1